MSNTGAKVAVADLRSTSVATGPVFMTRAFVAEGELCGDIELSSAEALSTEEVGALLGSLRFEPTSPPDFLGQFMYAKVLENHHALLAAGHVFELAAANASERRTR